PPFPSLLHAAGYQRCGAYTYSKTQYSAVRLADCSSSSCRCILSCTFRAILSHRHQVPTYRFIIPTHYIHVNCTLQVIGREMIRIHDGSSCCLSTAHLGSVPREDDHFVARTLGGIFHTTLCWCNYFVLA
ncbi:unnamed protein product, partial [Sphacelaria rigidula]